MAESACRFANSISTISSPTAAARCRTSPPRARSVSSAALPGTCLFAATSNCSPSDGQPARQRDPLQGRQGQGRIGGPPRRRARLRYRRRHRSRGISRLRALLSANKARCRDELGIDQSGWRHAYRDIAPLNGAASPTGTRRHSTPPSAGVPGGRATSEVTKKLQVRVLPGEPVRATSRVLTNPDELRSHKNGILAS